MIRYLSLFLLAGILSLISQPLIGQELIPFTPNDVLQVGEYQYHRHYG